MKRSLPVALAAFLGACLWVNPETAKRVSEDAADLERRRTMVQYTETGPLEVNSIVYKPEFLPLATFLKRLAKGDIKDARHMTLFRYRRANVDDEALKALISKGYIPVFVEAKNSGSQPIDARGLRLSLRDASFSLAPIPNEELRNELKSLNPNTTLVIASAIVVLTAAVLLEKAEDKVERASSSKNVDGPRRALADSISGKVYTDGVEEAGEDSSFDTGNAIMNPLHKTTEIDYNGLFFSAAMIAPGQSARGLLFFKAKGTDWSALHLEAALTH